MILRRASVIAALSLLASAAMAYAECAWVLWNEVSRDNGQVGWIAVQAEGTKRDCDQAANGKVKDAASEAGAIVKGNIIRPQSLPLSYRFVCLPDTVDPRGPKGK
jgi:hypothetical protein